MQLDSNHNLRIWLLALMVVFAPMQAAVSAIDMLDQVQDQQQHCQMDMTVQMDHGDMDPGDMSHGDCCSDNGACAENCSSCTQCFSVHAMLLGQLDLQQQLNHQFIYQTYSLAIGLPDATEFRPPRFFS